MAEYYLAGWGQVLDTVVPAAVRGQVGTRSATLLSVPAAVVSRLNELKLPPKQARALARLAESTRPLLPEELASLADCTLGPISALRKKGFIEARRERLQSYQPVAVWRPAHDRHCLNADQQRALDTIVEALNAGEHRTILIRGVTGSGKTEVYIRAIESMVGGGRQAIVLVPEISLTPQMTERFCERFQRVAVLHSHLSDSERHASWQEIARGEVPVIVGARSAVFAPTPHLGLLILDEEHETSFKQDARPRYHAREVARQRAADQRVPLVLASATPSLESWQRTVEGEYRLVEMPRRVLDRPLPGVGTIDLRVEARDRHTRGAISRPLHQAMHEALRAGGQVILLLNRRGFSTHIQCPRCGEVMKCPQCEIALTHHRTHETAICHYCNYQTAAPHACPHCQFTGIRYRGLGTQRLELEVRSRFPDHPCLRMDTDSMRHRGSHGRALAAFRRGEVRILLGTQMIAKGLDFPNVTLVGVINADIALHLPDFRAAERTFQLVTQVAGRTGRGEQGGCVLVQTFDPEHPAIQAAVGHDYDRFVRSELPARAEHGYPPYSSMVRVVVHGPAEKQAFESAGQLATLIRDALGQCAVEARVLGPAPAPLAKLRGNYRFQIQAHSIDGNALRSCVRQAIAARESSAAVQWIVDVDPVDMM
jgi:primosomal protein N' (replication factor Y)